MKSQHQEILKERAGLRLQMLSAAIRTRVGLLATKSLLRNEQRKDINKLHGAAHLCNTEEPLGLLGKPEGPAWTFPLFS